MKKPDSFYDWKMSFKSEKEEEINAIGIEKKKFKRLMKKIFG